MTQRAGRGRAAGVILLAVSLIAPPMAVADPVGYEVPPGEPVHTTRACPAFDGQTFKWQTTAGLGAGALMALLGAGLFALPDDSGEAAVALWLGAPVGAATLTQLVHDECATDGAPYWTAAGAILGLAVTLGTALAWSGGDFATDSPFTFVLTTGLLGAGVAAPTGAALAQLSRRDAIWYEMPRLPAAPPGPASGALPPLTLRVNLLRVAF